MSDYPIIIKELTPEDGGGYLAWAPDLPGCMSDGDSVDEAAENCRAAIGEWIDHALQNGESIPSPALVAFA